MKKTFLILILFLSFTKCYALEKCTPSKDYKEYEKLNNKELYEEPIYCNEIKNNTSKNSFNTRIQLKNGFGKISLSTTLSDKYNALEEGYITGIKNQYSLGTCWAFSAISSVESNALKNKLDSYDFSEAHMIYSLISGGYKDEAGKVGKYKTENLNGGQINYAATYYFNGLGQLNEEEMPYPKTYKTITIDEYIPGRDIISIEKFEINNVNDYGKCTNNEIEIIKSKLIEYGAVQATMYMDENLFKDSNKNYYISTNSNSTNANHGISIIGWDDTINKSNFKDATRDGAWLIKNSWGNNWSNDGLFYISYDDNFICKNVASYIGASTDKFNYKYKSADLVGLPIFYFSNSFYTSAKFTKQSENEEEIKRISFPTGENITYKVYLSKNNTINDKNDWILLKEGHSNALGIDSINLNEKINNDFTIITEYKVDTGKNSSILTLCNDKKDTEDINISKNTNYYSNNGTQWYDMESIKIGDEKISCEPNIYAYTNLIENEDENISISISSISKIDNNTINVLINKNDINIDNIIYSINDSTNRDVTNHFTITPSYDKNIITIKNDNQISGVFTLKLQYEDLIISRDFTLDEIIKSLNSKTRINVDTIILIVDKDKTYNYKNLIDSISISNTTIKIYDVNNNIINQDTSTIGTDYILTTNNKNYKLIVKGDATQDGTVNSADLLKIVKYLKGSNQLSKGQQIASDCTNDSIINSADLLKIVKYLKGTSNITM